MLPPLVTLDARLRRLLRDAPAVAPRTRLARELRHAHDLAMVEAGRTGWKTADVLPIDTLLARTYTELADVGSGGAERELLSRDSFRIAAERAAPDEYLARHVELFMTAWGLAHEWRLFAHESELQRSDNGRAFVAWARRFEDRCRENGWITTPELPAALTLSAREETALPRRLAFLGIDRLSPARRDWLEAITVLGTSVVELPLPSAGTVAATRVARTQTSSGELALVAAWARETLAAEPGTTMGIVVPTLNRVLARFRAQFQAAFDDIHDVDRFVNFGGGDRLTAEGVCRDALRLIDWSLHPLHFEVVAGLLRSPFIRLPDEATGPLSPTLPAFFDLQRLITPSHGLAGVSLAAPVSALPSAWGRHFRRLLHEGRWFDVDLEQREHQARLHFDELLLGFGAQDSIVGRCDGTEALRLLKMIAATRTFSQSSPNAPIQVLSREDSLGLTFDRIWVLGADDSSWPRPADPNPFIPTRLQKDARIPRVTPADEMDWARNATESWLANAKEVTFSHAQTDGDTERRPSRLLPQVAPISAEGVLQDPLLATYRHPYMRPRPTRLEERIDERGSTLVAPVVVSGGVAVLRDQSICPFRGYAIHRLDLPASTPPHSLPDALERGVLVHDAAARLFAAHGTSDSLLALSAEDIRTIVAETVDVLGADWPIVFRSHEVKRLTLLLENWVHLERKRSPFEIQTIEGPTSIELGGLRLRLRPDRCDQADNGQIALIDFKTSPASVMEWRLPRPREPQLPLYATAVPETGAVAFAQLVPDRIRLNGIADDMAGFNRPGRLGADDFETLKAGWRDALTVLAREYGGGLATVAPQRRADCRNCHLHSLCRVFESP